MAASIKMFSKFPLNLLGAKLCDMDSETKILCALYTDAAAPNQETMNDKVDVDATMTEVADSTSNGNGYTTGGKALTTTAITEATRVTKYDAVDVAWTVATITARYAVIYDDTEAAEANQPVICYIDFGENKSSENGTFQLTWNASGIFSITVAA